MCLIVPPFCNPTDGVANIWLEKTAELADRGICRYGIRGRLLCEFANNIVPITKGETHASCVEAFCDGLQPSRYREPSRYCER
jgi:hypothetical protein